MLAIDIIRDFELRGFTLGIAGDGGLSVMPASHLTDEDRTILRAYRTELLWRLKHPDGDPDAPIWRPPSTPPFIDDNGDLIIPLDAPEKYRYWQGGQSVEARLKELNAPIIRKRG
jgi:hypothetical protein